MGFLNVYMHTLQPGLRFSLSMHISGLYSTNRCWIFWKMARLGISFIHQTGFSHNFPCIYLVNTLLADSEFYKFPIFEWDFIPFHISILHAGFNLSELN